jgi:O-antigen/teichoic acid export membrane protein
VRQGWNARARALELGLYAAGPVSSLATAPILARSLGPEDRGTFGLVQALVTISLAVTAAGQPEVYLAEYRTGIDTHARSRRAILVVSSLGILLMLPAMVHVGVPIIAAVVVALTLIPLALTNLWRAQSISVGNLVAPGMSLAVAGTLRVACLLLILLLSELTLSAALVSYQLALLTAMLCTLGLVVHRIRKSRPATNDPASSVAAPGYGDLLARGAPVVGFNLLTAVVLRGDVFALQALSSKAQLGLYVATVGLTQAALSLSAAFRTRVLAACMTPNYRAAVAREFKLVGALAAAGAIFGILLAPVIVRIMLGEEFVEATNVFRVLCVAAIGQVMLDLVHGALASTGRRRELFLLACAGAIVITGGLLAFVPSGGALGAAVATVIGYGVASVLGGRLLLRAKTADVASPVAR